MSARGIMVAMDMEWADRRADVIEALTCLAAQQILD